jgi:hypothetical protein
MNWKQKILTLVALAVFVPIVAIELFGDQKLRLTMPYKGLVLTPLGTELLVLVVVYAGLFFVLADRRK